MPVAIAHSENAQFYQKVAEELDIPKELIKSNPPNKEGVIGLGIVHNARVMGNRMIVDVKGVPAKFAALVKAEGWGFNFTSPKLVPYWPGDKGLENPILGPIMCALTFLGAKQPAYTNQRPLADATVLGLSDEVPVFALFNVGEEYDFGYGEDHVKCHCGICTKMQAVYRDQMISLEGKHKEGDTKMGLGDFDNGIGQNPSAWPNQKPTDDFKSQLDGTEDPMTEEQTMKLASTIAESVVKTVGDKVDEKLEAKFAEIDAKFAKQEAAAFQSSISGTVNGWKHLDDEDKSPTLDTIVKLHATDPVAAQAMVDQHQKMSSKFEKAQNGGSSSPGGFPGGYDDWMPSEFRSQAPPFIGGEGSRLFEQGDDNRQNESDINKAILKFSQENQMDFAEALQTMSQNDRFRGQIERAIMEGSLRGGMRMAGPFSE